MQIRSWVHLQKLIHACKYVQVDNTANAKLNTSMWVNYDDLTATSLEWWSVYGVTRVATPKLAKDVRSVNYELL